MYSTFEINTRELDSNFLKTIQNLFKEKNIIITIEENEDETEYLLKDKVLIDRIKKVKSGKAKMKEFTDKQFDNLINKTL